MLKKNVKTQKKLHTNMWRKVALSAWNRPNEPVIYSRVALNPEPALKFLETLNKNSTNKITITHYLGKVCGILLEKYDDLNSTILYKNAYVREGSDIFFHASLIDKYGKENLSGAKIENCAQKTIEEIANELNHQNSKVKSGEDVTFDQIKKVMAFIPIFISGFIIKLTAFIQYRLNIWSPLLGTKKDTFGSMMITNIGSLGIEEAFVPFSHYTNVHSICALGKISEAPVVREGELKVGLVQYACWTLDHRVIDGSNAAKMLESLKLYFENPELIMDYDQKNKLRK